MLRDLSILLALIAAPPVTAPVAQEQPPEAAASTAPSSALGPAVDQPAAEATFAPVAAPPTTSTAPAVAPAGSLLQIALLDPVSSKDAKPGQKFRIVLVEPLMIGDRIAIPAGAKGEGEVVHAAHSGIGGKAGELILAARYLQVGDQQVKLKAFQFSGAGRNNQGGAILLGTAAGFFVPGGSLVQLVVQGGEINAAAGTHASAKLAADFSVSPAPEPRP